MKKNLLIAILFMATSAMAQVPVGFSFQGVARDGGGQVKNAQSITVQVSLIPLSTLGGGQTAEWRQTFQTVTDQYGVFSVIVGQVSSTPPNIWSGNLVNPSVTFDKLNWISTRYEMLVQDITTGKAVTVGSSPLASVPYATVAQNVVNENDPLFKASPAKDIKATDTTRWAVDNDKQQLTVNHNKLSIANGNTVGIDADTTNEIQDLVLSGDKLYITKNASPNQIDLTKYTTDAQTLSVTGNELSISGSNSKVDLSNLQLKSPVITSSVNGQLTGQIQSILVGDSAVVGKNTLFKTELMVGSIVRFGTETDLYEVYSITDNTHLTLTKQHPLAITTFTNYFSTSSMLNVKTPTGDTAFSVTAHGRLQDATGFVMPVGTIIAFGGETVPKGWLACDGSILKRADYPELFAAIGTAWGTTASDNFTLPYTIGLFLRGVSSQKLGYDPDSLNRVPRGTGGASGNHVGSFQYGEMKNHNHDTGTLNIQSSGSHGHEIKMDVNGGSIGFVGGSATGSGLVTSGGRYGTASASPSEHSHPNSSFSGNTGFFGGSETRPVNVYVNYIIKY